MSEKITICSVYHSYESKKLLEVNYDLVKKLNPGADYVWVVADNSPADFTDKLKSDGRFLIVPGAEKPVNITSWLRGSYHHSRAVNASLQYIKTRYAIILDSDFYVVRKNWINDILRCMAEQNLLLLGSPWHPSHTSKYRYFPAHHFLAMDLSKIDLKSLDFTPDYDFVDDPRKRSLKQSILRRFFNVFPFLRSRYKIGKSRDTAYKLFLKYGGNAYFKDSFECLVPVFKPRFSSLQIFFENLLPDRFSKMPKKSGYFSTDGFKSFGYFDADAEGWEEFLWLQKPFGFHIRGSHKLKKDWENKLATLRECLQSFDAV